MTRRLERAAREAYRESDAHREGPDLDLVVEWAAGARDRARRRDRRRARRAAAARGRARGRHAATRRPGCSPDVICRAEELPFADGELRRRRLPRRARTTSPTSRAAVARDGARRARPRARRRQRSSWASDVEEAERLRDPSHVRNYTEAEWRALLRGAPGSRSRRCGSSTSRSSSSRGSTARAARATDAERVRELARRPDRRRLRRRSTGSRFEAAEGR